MAPPRAPRAGAVPPHPRPTPRRQPLRLPAPSRCRQGLKEPGFRPPPWNRTARPLPTRPSAHLCIYPHPSVCSASHPSARIHCSPAQPSPHPSSKHSSSTHLSTYLPIRHSPLRPAIHSPPHPHPQLIHYALIPPPAVHPSPVHSRTPSFLTRFSSPAGLAALGMWTRLGPCPRTACSLETDPG